MFLATLIKRIARNLDKRSVPYMIIGGQAVLLYGTPRLTRDIDITLGVDTDQFSSIGSVCKDVGLKILPDDPESFARQTKVLPAEDPESRIRVDFVFSFTPYEAQAITRAQAVLMEGYPVRFATREDVIIHKMVAGRAIDEEDVKGILGKNKGAIDLAYIHRWLLQFAEIPEHSQILDKFDNLLSR
jgi:predicted nucleotidyltransferase